MIIHIVVFFDCFFVSLQQENKTIYSMATKKMKVTANASENIEMIRMYMGSESLSDLARILGISAQRISSWCIRGTYDTRVILKAIPEIREEWLATGEGEMLRENGTASLIDELRELRELLNSKDAVILQQAQHIAELTKQLKRRR